eukprot:scaffold6196_cov113-Isochrysis_galbana.AAC.12
MAAGGRGAARGPAVCGQRREAAARAGSGEGRRFSRDFTEEIKQLQTPQGEDVRREGRPQV